MRVVFLGSGTSFGVPVIGCGCAVCASGDPRDKRYRASVLIESGGASVVVDAGPEAPPAPPGAPPRRPPACLRAKEEGASDAR